MSNYIIRRENIAPYGDDTRAIIRAFADQIHGETDKENLEYLRAEIDFILRHEL